jgi:hypothetical protein
LIEDISMPITRRAILRISSLGFAMIGLNGLLAAENPLAPKQPHLVQRAKRVIVLFMDGGPSHIDSFDRKPRLEKDHLKPPPFKLGMVFNKDFGLGNLMKSPYEFKRYGQMGMEVSDLFPNVAQHVDKMCFVRSMVADGLDHGGALLQMHTGTLTLTRPSFGSWMLYGLGTEQARKTDKPIAGLLADLESRGLLKDTLVVWGGEFGRTPFMERDGRDHNPYGFTFWMAGGGVKQGFIYGATDEFGYHAVEDRMHVHDFHATLLHLMTDVSGTVATKLLA